MHETWRKVWRQGIAWQLPEEGLEALAVALANDDKTLIQGSTTHPPPLVSVRHWPIEGADAIAFAGLKCGTLEHDDVGGVEEFFSKVCFECNQKMNEPAAVRWFLNWYDDTPREEVFRELLLEVKAELWRRNRLEVCERLGLAHDTPDYVLFDFAEEIGEALDRLPT